MSGDDNQVLYTEAYASFADFEATRKKGEEAFAASPALQAEMEAHQAAVKAREDEERARIAAKLAAEVSRVETIERVEGLIKQSKIRAEADQTCAQVSWAGTGVSCPLSSLGAYI